MYASNIHSFENRQQTTKSGVYLVHILLYVSILNREYLCIAMCMSSYESFNWLGQFDATFCYANQFWNSMSMTKMRQQKFITQFKIPDYNIYEHCIFTLFMMQIGRCVPAHCFFSFTPLGPSILKPNLGMMKQKKPINIEWILNPLYEYKCFSVFG